MQEHHEQFRDAGVRIVVLSADGPEGAKRMKSDEDLEFPVLHGLDCEDVRDRFGVYMRKGDERTHLQPAQFILDPEGVVRLASYSTGKVGRLEAREALEEIESIRS